MICITRIAVLLNLAVASRILHPFFPNNQYVRLPSSPVNEEPPTQLWTPSPHESAYEKLMNIGHLVCAFPFPNALIFVSNETLKYASLSDQMEFNVYYSVLGHHYVLIHRSVLDSYMDVHIIEGLKFIVGDDDNTHLAAQHKFTRESFIREASLVLGYLEGFNYLTERFKLLEYASPTSTRPYGQIAWILNAGF